MHDPPRRGSRLVSFRIGIAIVVCVSIWSAGALTQESSPDSSESSDAEPEASADEGKASGGEAKAARSGRARYFPKVPHVENLTEGFRIEKTFSSIAVAPTDPDRVYLGTSNSYIYTSPNGGTTWDQHDLMEMPQLSGFPLKPRTGISLKYRPPLAVPDRYAEGYGWPEEELWSLPDMLPSELMRPGSFRPGEIIPPNVTVVREYTGEYVDLLFGRNLRIDDVPVMPPNLGFGRKLYSKKQGRKRLRVDWIEVHPEDPEKAFAVTNDGLWRSNDGGYSWKREYDQALAEYRATRHINFYPSNPDIRFLCTDKGLYVTRDAGVSYSKVEAPIINRIGCYWVTFHPDNPREIWVGTVFGVWVSKDFGKSFDLIFYTRVPGQIQIHQVKFDPTNPDNILLASSEIVFSSRDGGESFERVGTYSFANQKIANVLFTGEPGELIVATRRDVWRSTDGGRTWQPILFGNVGWYIQRAFFPRGPDGPMWLLTEGELLSLDRTAPKEVSHRKRMELEDLFHSEPSMSETMIRALRAHRAWRPALNDYRRKARTSHLLPKLQVVGTHRRVDGHFLGRGRLYGRTGPDELPAKGLESYADFRDWHLEVWGTWNLGRLIFDRRAVPMGQNFKYNRQLARSIRESIQLIYAERRRLQIKQVLDPSDSPRTRALRRVRIEELTELLDIMTRGWFSRYVEGASGSAGSGR